MKDRSLRATTLSSRCSAHAMNLGSYKCVLVSYCSELQLRHTVVELAALYLGFTPNIEYALLICACTQRVSRSHQKVEPNWSKFSRVRKAGQMWLWAQPHVLELSRV